MNFTIRKAKESDAQAIFNIIRELGWFAWVNLTSDETNITQIQQHITQCDQNDSHSIYVAENTENGIIGYIAVHWLPCPFLPKLQGYISELFVQKAARGLSNRCIRSKNPRMFSTYVAKPQRARILSTRILP
ncbi:hypothetical protein [Nostoc sphaeroides]|uniref:N-acetyltransferase n=1 Tax=Nostoc sphaeroides CCNUC1 TaxID=2653204 RepID=A0A5P8WEZ8_9NOSO|nr:hypothetical protein [Nostoc sphaeroides]QFS51234.1 hypothetical protein GXM_08728 [Nostoc sphaeroides CCNUC1]